MAFSSFLGVPVHLPGIYHFCLLPPKITMSSSASAQPDPRGSFPEGNAPWVVVRAGKTYLCSSCGTLVEVPADVVGQLVIALNPAQPEEPSPEEPIAPTPSASSESTDHADDQAVSASIITQAPRPNGPKRASGSRCDRPRPARPRRPKAPRMSSRRGQMIDGLRVPTAKELDRALAWVSFHLKVLDRQGSELNRLKKQIKKRSQPEQGAPQPLARETHAHADVGMAPGMPGTADIAS